MKFANNDFVSEQIQRKIKKYSEYPEDIVTEYRREDAELKGYHGRELLELIQNAVDELNDITENAIEISFSNDKLTISNNGNIFTEDGIISIFNSHLSPKYKQQKYIGNKGTGFRSVLNWADSIRVYSGDLSIEFNKKYAVEMIKTLMQSKNVQKATQKYGTLSVATLVAPKIINPLMDKRYDTVIEIDVLPHMFNSVTSQIDELNATTLLFLGKLNELKIRYFGKEITYKKTPNDDMPSARSVQNITVTTSENGVEKNSEHWLISFHEGRIAETENSNEFKNYCVAVAFKEDASFEENTIFSFFKTKIPFPFPVLIHGTFDLDANRNHLNESDDNKAILKAACELMVRTIVDINKDEVNYASLKLLSPYDSFSKELAWFGIEEFYNNLISASCIFPTVNQHYITFKENPKFYSSHIADFLFGANFEDLLIYTEEMQIQNYIFKLAKIFQSEKSLKYPYSTIVQGINKVLTNTKISERAELCWLFLEEYPQLGEVLPNFILDEQNNTVNDGMRIYLPPDDATNFVHPPAFTKIVYMSNELMLAFRALGDGSQISLRALSDKLSPFNVNEYSLKPIISGVVSSANKSSNQEKVERWNEIIYWIWKMYNLEQLKNIDLSDIDFKILSKDGDIQSGKSLFFSKEFGGTYATTEKLLPNRKELFLDFGIMNNITNEEKDDFINFLMNKIGISIYPRSMTTKMSSCINSEYSSYIKDNLRYPIQAVWDTIFMNKNELQISTIEVATIEHYEEILHSADTACIVTWLIQDANARELVCSKNERTSSKLYVLKGNQQNYRTISGDSFPSYMNWCFNNHAWVKLDNQLYSAQRCLTKSNVGNSLAPIIIGFDIDKLESAEMLSVFNKKDIDNLLVRIGFPEIYADLTTDVLYEMLLKLPTSDPQGKISKLVYSSITTQNSSLRLHKSSGNYRKFMNEGEVFCKESRKYVPIGEAKYLTEKTVSREVLKNFNIIDIPNRRNSARIKEYFGVEKLELKGRVIGTPKFHKLDNEYRSEFDSLKPFILCYRLDSKNSNDISVIKSLQIRLCLEVFADYGNGKVSMSDYSFIKAQNNDVYLKIDESIHSIQDLHKNQYYCATVAEIITSTIDIQDEALFKSLQLICGQDEQDRYDIIDRDFDDTEILKETMLLLGRAVSKTEQFFSVCKIISKGRPSTLERIKNEIEKLNLNEINSAYNRQVLYNILEELNVDIAEFNAHSEFKIDFIPYYVKEYRTLVSKYEQDYKNCLYNEYCKKDISEKGQFIKKYNEFKFFEYAPFNSITVNPENDFLSKWKFTQNHGLVADDLWRKYHDEFMQNHDAVIVNELLSVMENDSLLYFGEIEILDSRYKEVKNRREVQTETEHTTIGNVGVPQVNIEVVDVQASVQQKTGDATKTAAIGSRKAGMLPEHDKVEWGRYAERLVYENYKTKFNNVKWVSENAKKENVNPDGIGGLGYDLTYIDENGGEIFVEIKSTTGSDIKFVLTENEFNVAEKHADNYEIALVINIKQEQPEIKILKQLFKYSVSEQRWSNSKFSLQSESYVVLCQEV